MLARLIEINNQTSIVLSNRLLTIGSSPARGLSSHSTQFISHALARVFAKKASLAKSVISLSADDNRLADEVEMLSLLTPSIIRKVALVGSIIVLLGLGVAEVLKSTVDYLLYWDATAAAESWAKYVAENVDDVEEIANGQPPSAESMAFFIRTQQIRYVFGFEIINLHGDIQLTSDGSKISSVRGAMHSDTAARAAELGRPIIAVKEGVPPVRPKNYSEAFLPVMFDGRPQAIVAAYVDLSEQNDHFRRAFLLADSGPVPAHQLCGRRADHRLAPPNQRKGGSRSARPFPRASRRADRRRQPRPTRQETGRHPCRPADARRLRGGSLHGPRSFQGSE